jgi:ADP-ribosylglycohydrolase
LIRQQSCEFADLPEFESELGPALEKAHRLVSDGANMDEIADEIGTTGFVLHTVPLAFAALWSRPQTFLQGLQSVVLQGGDADSNGAVAGALLGAHFGSGAIPRQLIDSLEPCHGRERLVRLADALYAGEGKVVRPSSLALRWRELQIKFGVGLHVLGRLIP